MTKINLLPKEILEKRKSESRLLQIFIGFFVLVVILGGIYTLVSMQVGQEQKKLDNLKTENNKLNKAITEYKVYEERKVKLQELDKTITTALSGEIAWHKILNEVSMVIPSDVWIDEFVGDITEGITCRGYAIDYDFDTPDLGHKPVAEWIVRMSEIKVLTSIWLNYTQKATFKEQPAIQFEITTQLEGEKPASAPAAPPTKE